MAHLIYSALPQPRRPVIYVHPHVTVSQCIEMMVKQDIGALVIHDEISRKVLGIVTERDILRSCLHYGLDPAKTRAIDIAYVNFSVLDLFDPVENAMEIITTTKRRYVLIAEEGNVIAILSIGDLLFHLLEDKTRVIEQLENYIHTY